MIFMNKTDYSYRKYSLHHVPGFRDGYWYQIPGSGAVFPA